MSQIFHPSTNTIARVSIFGALFFLVGAYWLADTLYRSPFVAGENVHVDQPVPFSHKHHVRAIGIDCRFCHTSVQKSSFAGIPSTDICMNCHSQIWSDSPMLEPVRESYRTGKSIPWNRVNWLPDFVYFNHSIHVKKGVGCATCHGQVDQMPLTFKHASLYMEWCLECHRAPERFVRPREQVFNMNWTPQEDQIVLGRKLVKDYKIRSVKFLTNCSVCHR